MSSRATRLRSPSARRCARWRRARRRPSAAPRARSGGRPRRRRAGSRPCVAGAQARRGAARLPASLAGGCTRDRLCGGSRKNSTAPMRCRRSSSARTGRPRCCRPDGDRGRCGNETLKRRKRRRGRPATASARWRRSRCAPRRRASAARRGGSPVTAAAVASTMTGRSSRSARSRMSAIAAWRAGQLRAAAQPSSTTSTRGPEPDSLAPGLASGCASARMISAAISRRSSSSQSGVCAGSLPSAAGPAAAGSPGSAAARRRRRHAQQPVEDGQRREGGEPPRLKIAARRGGRSSSDFRRPRQRNEQFKQGRSRRPVGAVAQEAPADGAGRCRRSRPDMRRQQRLVVRAHALDARNQRLAIGLESFEAGAPGKRQSSSAGSSTCMIWPFTPRAAIARTVRSISGSGDRKSPNNMTSEWRGRGAAGAGRSSACSRIMNVRSATVRRGPDAGSRPEPSSPPARHRASAAPSAPGSADRPARPSPAPGAGAVAHRRRGVRQPDALGRFPFGFADVDAVALAGLTPVDRRSESLGNSYWRNCQNASPVPTRRRPCTPCAGRCDAPRGDHQRGTRLASSWPAAGPCRRPSCSALRWRRQVSGSCADRPCP